MQTFIAGYCEISLIKSASERRNHFEPDTDGYYNRKANTSSANTIGNDTGRTGWEIECYPAGAIRAELSKAQEATVNAEKFMNVVRKYTSFEELTPTLLREFVEKIVVHECSYDENGTRRQDIDIYYSFVGKVDLPE